MMHNNDEGSGKADLGMSGMPPQTHNAPSGNVPEDKVGYQHPSSKPCGMDMGGSACTAPGQATSKEMMGKMGGGMPAPSKTQ